MFKTLDYSVKFPPNLRFPDGQQLQLSVTLKAGFWAIVGSNETGKSMILEMLRFLLFGTAALRGRADDYKTLKAAGTFTIRDVEYSVDRTMKTARLRRGTEDLASGVTTVNAKIVELLGYGIKIFDMANSVNQGEVERLGAMLPSERKSMVDGVLGIDALDVVAKWGMEEARLNDRAAEAIRGRLVCPVQPVAPEGYVVSSDIPVAALRADATELAQIEGFLSVTRDKPQQPTCAVDLPAENIRSFAAKRAELREAVARNEARAAVLPAVAEAVPDDIEEQWEKFDAGQAALQWLKANPAPADDEDDLRQWLKDWAVLGEWTEEQSRQLERLGLSSTIKDAAHVDCPKCSHHFPLNAERIAQYAARLAELEAIPEPTTARPATPPHTQAECSRRLQVVLDFDAATFATMTVIDKPEAPAISKAFIEVMRAQVAQVAERTEILKYLATAGPELAAMPDYEQMLVERTAYEAALPAYRAAMESYADWVEQKVLKEGRKLTLQGVRERLLLAEATHAAAVSYEQAQARFGADYDAYTSGVTEADQLEAVAIEHRKVRDAMANLRSLIKQHLMPSLNRVASHLLTQMTGGQRTSIVVDEDFNVMVDGQDLDTLSGSGKACANLSLRIALGQVLTNRVFSVLLADEIDASMDEFRAGETSNVLYTLGNSISQVLQVSHKTIESVNSIDLGDTLGSGSH